MLEENLISHYWLACDATDETGNYDGVDNIVTYDGNSAYFNGTGGHIEIPGLTVAVLNFNSKNVDLTYSFFFKITTSTVVNSGLFYIGNLAVYSPNYSYFGSHISSDGNSVRVGVYDGGTEYDVANPLSIDSIIHIVCVRKNSILYMYYNGVYVGETNQLTDAQISSSANLKIGGHDNSASFKGNISNVRIYSDAKDQSFIDELYAEGPYKPPIMKDVDSSNGYLEATDTDGYAVSKPIVQDNGRNISVSTQADLLLSKDEIVDGDSLVIELDDGSYNDFTAQNVIESIIDSYDPFGDNSGIALYKFDDNANDESGNYNGTEVSINYVDGKFNKGIQGNKSAHSYISSSLSLGTTSSISFWVKESDLSGDQLFITNNNDAFIAASYTNYWMKASSSVVVFSDGNKMIPTIDDWYHIVLTDDGSNIRGYRNGIEITNNVSYLSINGFVFNFIGAYTSAGPSHSGILDQLRVFNRALTQQEINDLYLYEDKYRVDTSSVTNGEVPDKVYFKDTFLPDFTGVENIVGKFEYKNISESDTADELRTTEKIKDGDNLVIVKNNDSVHEVVANGVIDDSYIDGDFTSGYIGSLEHGVSSTVEIENNKAKIIGTANAPYVHIWGDTIGIVHNEEYDLQVIGCTASNPRVDVDINGGDGNGNGNGSLSGTYRFTSGTSSTDIQIYDINGSSGSVFYVEKILFTRVSDGSQFIINQYKLDTSSITQGEIPSRVYRNDESVFFNGNEATVDSNSYTVGDPLLSDKSFNSVDTPSRSITTKVQMSATSNIMRQLDFDIMRQPKKVEFWVDENSETWIDEDSNKWTIEL